MRALGTSQREVNRSGYCGVCVKILVHIFIGVIIEPYIYWNI